MLIIPQVDLVTLESLFHSGNSLFPELDKASLKQPSIEVRLRSLGAGTCVQTATTGLGLQSDIIQLSGLSMGLDVDGRTGPLLLHSSPFKPEGVTVSMSDTGGQEKVLDCSNVISDDLGLLSCIFRGILKGPCVYIHCSLCRSRCGSPDFQSPNSLSVCIFTAPISALKEMSNIILTQFIHLSTCASLRWPWFLLCVPSSFTQ